MHAQEKQEKADTEFKHSERVVCVLWNPTHADGLVTSAYERQIRCPQQQLTAAIHAQPLLQLLTSSGMFDTLPALPVKLMCMCSYFDE